MICKIVLPSHCDSLDLPITVDTNGFLTSSHSNDHSLYQIGLYVILLWFVFLDQRGLFNGRSFSLRLLIYHSHQLVSIDTDFFIEVISLGYRQWFRNIIKQLINFLFLRTATRHTFFSNICNHIALQIYFSASVLLTHLI